ncbi:LysR substrate-binding domain-containing protein [Streptomyces sp. NBC_00576]|uniref:LysR substrate-binding domain-containing protein n=1 Tax=Streptomyces sp. NBC_00576 TaxID=2903665 RepID=UPI002E80D4B3|nr:LysR substrate-binding domain-containing protein [Streptomyces sp. NBC_00576]WUB76337.1 LysR substrate-binding domain-containing protein [Streptomyces sp. NBC_00576]
MTGSEDSPAFRLAYVPGVIPAKWVRIWNERRTDVPLTLLQVAAADVGDLLLTGDADAALVRLPVDRTVLSAISLYTEISVVVVPKDHVVAAVDEVTAEDLADDIVLHPLDDTLAWESLPGRPAIERPATTEDAIELVAAGIGVLVVPQSLARLHHRKDLTYRPVTDAPESQVALSWPEDRTTDLVEDFIGIVRGRTVNSSRGRRQEPEAEQPKTKKRSGTEGTARKPVAGRSAGRGAGKGGAAGRGARSGGSGKAGGARQGKPRRKS